MTSREGQQLEQPRRGSSTSQKKLLASLVNSSGGEGGVTPSPFSISISYTLPTRKRSGVPTRQPQQAPTPTEITTTHPPPQVSHPLRHADSAPPRTHAAASSETVTPHQSLLNSNRGGEPMSNTLLPSSTTPIPASDGFRTSAAPAAVINSNSAVLPSRAPQPPARSNVASRAAPQNRLAIGNNPGLVHHQTTVTRKVAVGAPESVYDGTEASFVDILMQKLREQVAALGGDEWLSNTEVIPVTASQIPSMSSTEALSQQRTLWAAVEARNRPSLLRKLPVELMMLIFEFMPIGDLCRATCVSKRVSIIANSPVLWVRFCQRYRLSFQRTDGLTFVKPPKEIVRDYLMETRRALDERLRYEVDALEAIEERLNHRVAQTAPFSQSFATESASEHPRLRQLIERAEQQLNAIVEKGDEMERARGELLRLSQSNRDMLLRAQTQLHHVMTTLQQQNVQLDGPSKGGSFSRGLGWVGVGSSSDAAPPSVKDVQLPQGALVHLDDVAFLRFERHVCQVIATHVQSDPRAELPIVLRRGLSSFSSMELLVLQLVGGSKGGHPIGDAWTRWKRLFPATANGEYFQLRDAFSSDVNSMVTSGPKAVSPAIPSSLAPCAAMVRKVLSMKPAELESLIFGE